MDLNNKRASKVTKDFSRADKYYDKPIELNPGYVENYDWKARTNYKLKRPAIYRPLFQKHIEMTPDTDNTLDWKKNWPHLLTGADSTPARQGQD